MQVANASSISKIFERIIFNQINDHFTSHDLYYNGQYGFREKHSTQLAALELIDRITHELYMGNTPINIYIDLSKAFDTLDHTILISKLQHYGITGAALQLLVSYLSNRKHFVQYGDIIPENRYFNGCSSGFHFRPSSIYHNIYK